MSIPRGDFIGFTIDGIHSSELGIIRVSDGSRFTENLLPDFSDKTVNVPGDDGAYYFGREYTVRNFNINVAYDNLHEEQLRKIKQLFYGKNTHEIIFDEYPYKIYDVVVKSAPQLKFLCFDDEYGRRVYKGEGTINLVSYCPYARAKYKFLEDYSGTLNDTLPDNVTSWYNFIPIEPKVWPGSGIISKYQAVSSGNSSIPVELDKFIHPMGNWGFYVFNPGDTPTPFKIAIIFPQNRHLEAITIRLVENTSGIQHILKLNAFDAQGEDNAILIDCDTGVISGSEETVLENVFNNPSNNLYNKYIKNGDFFNIPNTNELEWMGCSSSQVESEKIGIKYEYKYI